MAEPWKFLVDGLVTLLGAILGVTIGAWLTGIYKIKGELTGRAEMLGTILDEVRKTAKATEGTKIDTRAEKIEEILVEIKAVTKAQKSIEAKVAGGEWDRQWTLNQMREGYVRLLGALYGLQDYFHAVAYSGDKQDDAEDRAADDLYRKNAAEFKTGAAILRIFAGDIAVFALDQYEKAVKHRRWLPLAERPEQALKDIEALHTLLLKAAVSDLQVSLTTASVE